MSVDLALLDVCILWNERCVYLVKNKEVVNSIWKCLAYLDWTGSSGSFCKRGLGAPGLAVVGLSELLNVLLGINE